MQMQNIAFVAFHMKYLIAMEYDMLKVLNERLIIKILLIALKK